jgi:hypothetical protein
MRQIPSALQLAIDLAWPGGTCNPAAECHNAVSGVQIFATLHHPPCDVGLGAAHCELGRLRLLKPTLWGWPGNPQNEPYGPRSHRNSKETGATPVSKFINSPQLASGKRMVGVAQGQHADLPRAALFVARTKFSPEQKNTP